MKKVNFKKIAFVSLIIVIALSTSVIIYDRITINNQYYISEKNLNIPILKQNKVVY